MIRKMIPIFAVLLAGCANNPVDMQKQYIESCAAYSAGLNVAVELRKAGKLNAQQIDQITAVDAVATPLCTGQLPADLPAANTKLTAALTQMTAVTGAKQ